MEAHQGQKGGVRLFAHAREQVAALREIHRVLTPSGRLAVIEIMKKPMPFGPPLEKRISEEELQAMATENGFAASTISDLGFTYLAIFRKA